MNIFDFVNVGLIAGIIIFIQLIKYFFPKIKPNVWKIIVFIFGMIAAFLVTDFNDFSIQQLISNMIIYSGAATVFYQTGKMGVDKLFVKDKDDAK